MKFNILLLIIFQLIYFDQSSRSQIAKFQKVSLGQKMPSYEITDLINYPKNKIGISEFKGKILILDFWTFGCSACIASWPKLINLQKEFKDQIQIILVNVYENENKVQAFMDRQEKISGIKMNLPVICGDKRLKDFFPHQLVPHVVFIDEAGTVKYITEGFNLNREIIGNLLSHTEMNIPEKTDEFAEIDRSKPLFINGNNANKLVGENLLWSTIINPYSIELLSVCTFGRNKDRTYGWLANQSIATLFQILHGKGIDSRGMVSHSRVFFKNIDSSRIVSKVNGIFKTENCYTIQATAKRDVPVAQLKRKMISDLELCFGLKTGWELQKKTCLVLSKSKAPIYSYTKGERQLNISPFFIRANNVTIEEFLDDLTLNMFYTSNYPLVDETNFKGRLGEISITSKKRLNYLDLNNELMKYGLKLSIEECDVKVLAIERKLTVIQ